MTIRRGGEGGLGSGIIAGGRLYYPVVDEEDGITIQDFRFEPGDPIRYGAAADGITNDYTAINTAISTGLTIKLGGVNRTYLCNSSLTLQAGQVMHSYGATLKTTANITILNHNDRSRCVGVKFLGSGKASGLTNQVGVAVTGNGSYVGPTRTRTSMCEFKDFGGSGYRAHQIVEDFDGQTFVDFVIESCNIGLNLDERAEYFSVSGGTIASCTTGLYLRGGNNKVSTVGINNNTNGVVIATGSNDAHGSLSNCTINHNTQAIKVEAITVHDFQFLGCSVYFGTILLQGCQGVRFEHCTFGSVTNIYEDGALDCIFDHCLFETLPTMTPNYNSNQSRVYYYDCVWPSSVGVATSSRSQGAVSEVKQTSSYPTISTGTTHSYGFPNVVYNTVGHNTAYTLHNLYDTTNKYWDFTVLKSPRGSFWVDIGVNLSICKLGGAFSHDLVEAYLYETVSGTRLATLQPGAEKTNGTDYWRIFSFFGQVPKMSGKIGIRIVNSTGGDIVVLNDGATSPSYGWAFGW